MVRLLGVLFSLILVCPLFAHSERAISDMRAGVASSTEFRSMVGAGSANGFLVAWTSRDRGGQAMRFDATGRGLDGTSIGLPVAPRFVFHHDDVWFVIGDDGWARVDRDGALLDPQPRPFAQPLGRIIGGAWTGTALVLASYADRKLTAHAVDAGMNVTSSHVLLTNANNSIDVRVASDGDSAVIVYTDTSLTAALFDANGAFVRTKSISNDPHALAAVGSDGEDYLVVRYHAASGMTPASYGGLHLDRDLSVETAPTFIGHRGATLTHAPTLSWDGSAYTFFYMSPDEVRAARLAPDGERIEDAPVTDSDWTAITPLAGMHGVSADGATLFLYAKSEVKHGDAFLHARAGHSADDLGDAEEIPLEIGAMRQDMPAAASGNTVSLVVWRERVGASAPLRLYGTRVARDGTILDPHSIPIANGICELCAPAVASNGETFLIAWYSSSNALQATLLDANGVQQRFWLVEDYPPRYGVLRGEPAIVVTGKYYSIAWSFLGERYLTTQWADGYYFSGVPVLIGEGEIPLRGASSGTGYMLAWGSSATFARSWAAFDPIPISGDRVSGVWWNGTTYSVLHGDAGTFNVTRFDGAGKLVGTAAAFPRPQFETWGETSDPECDGKGCSLTFGSIEDGRFLLRNLRVDDDGSTVSHRLHGGAAVPRGHLQGDETMEIAPLQVPGGPVVAVYTRRALEPPYAGITRVFLRPLEAVRTRTVRR